MRHDPFAWMRGAPWMNRDLTPSGRAAAFLRRLLEDLPAIEGRQPNRADLDAIVKRTSDYMVPIFKRERPPTSPTRNWRSAERPASPRPRRLPIRPAHC